jgi:uncharacterized coiled-coil protein SlyX
MANRILKGLAIAAGTGLAMGFTTTRFRVSPGQRFVHTHPLPPATSSFESAPILPAEDGEFLDIEPLLDRLERLEARVEALEQPTPSSRAVPAGVPGDYAAAIADLERRVEENTRELALLREHVTEAERRVSESVASVQRNVERTRGEIPAIVERHVSVRIDDLQKRFASEIEQSHQRTVEMFDRAIDEKISSRIGSIERSLAEQAGSIEALSARSIETDNNLQRLVTAIEKLCERTQLFPPAAEQRLPFESQMHDAMNREPVVPVLRTEEPVPEVRVPAPPFTGSEASAPKKSRFLFRNLIVAGFSLLASRLFR